MGNDFVTKVTKLKDPMAFFLKYYHEISFIKLLRIFFRFIYKIKVKTNCL